jgi:uncharacterized protein YlxP (DUF503 family)
MRMFVLALQAELHVEAAQSLKAKRQVVRALLDGARHRFGVSVAEIDHQDLWQRATLGFAVVASTERQAVEIMDAVDRFIWAKPEVAVVALERRWLE